MNRDERADEAIQRAEDLGLRLEFDSGLMVVVEGAETIVKRLPTGVDAGTEEPGPP